MTQARSQKVGFIRSRIHLILLFCICLILLVSHTAYVLVSHQYPVWDEHQYMFLAASYYDILKSPSLDFYNRILTVSYHRQPIYPLLLTGLLFIFGSVHAYKVALLFNGILYITTVICVYVLARKYMGKTASLMAAIIACFYGNALFFLHFTYSETAITTMVMLALTFLAYSDGFTKDLGTAGASLATGAAWLTKWAGLPFMVLPIMVEGVRGIFAFIKEKKKRISITKHWAVFVMWGILFPIFLFYLPNFAPFMDYVFKNQYEGPEWVRTYRSVDFVNTFSIRSVMYYWNILSQNTIFFLALFIAGTLVSIRYCKRYYFILLAFASQYAFLTFVTIWKEDRYAVSLYPLMAILSATVFEHIRIKPIRTFLVSITVGLSFLVLLGASWGAGPMGKQGLLDYVTPRWLPHPRRMYLTPLVWPPRTEYINAYQFIDILEKDPLQKPTVTQLFSYEPWDNVLTSVVSYEKRSLFRYVVFSGEMNADQTRSLLTNAYVLTRNEPFETYLNRNKLISPSSYTKITDILLPIDGSTVSVYKKIQ